MISLKQFLEGCKKNAARIKTYKEGKSGQNGESDCIGYVIGAMDLAGQKWGGIHGSNYSARYRTKNLHKVSKASDLKLGELVYKAYSPGDSKYTLPDKYRQGGASYNGDLNDYYHVGVVTSVNPLEISHCSGGGMHYDKSLGKWSYAGECSLVNYSDSAEPDIPAEPTEAATGEMVVDVPDDTSVNVRNRNSTSGSIIAKLPEGTKVNVTAVNGEWSKVEYKQTGYIMSRYLRKG